MKKSKLFLKSSLVTVLAVSFALPAYAETDGDLINSSKPDQQVINNITYLNGIEVIPDDYAGKRDAELKEIVQVPKSKDQISTRGINKWTKISESNFYTGHDWDRYNNNTSKAVSVTLKTTSSMTASISGSTKFGFKDVAEASMTATIGETYSKEFTQSVSVPGYYVTELKSAKKALEQNYKYTDTGIIWDTDYYASSLDHRGNEYWVFSNPL
ncbi:hypothetical protein [Paenibacillus sp. GCM10012306]|uniref:hypothetical protein n=1 Tax=Paenibacillus sp. GCM10012306 TaxID=3317342 RepID=UPI003619D544